jgi:hypothetical protein
MYLSTNEPQEQADGSAAIASRELKLACMQQQETRGPQVGGGLADGVFMRAFGDEEQNGGGGVEPMDRPDGARRHASGRLLVGCRPA